MYQEFSGAGKEVMEGPVFGFGFQAVPVLQAFGPLSYGPGISFPFPGNSRAGPWRAGACSRFCRAVSLLAAAVLTGSKLPDPKRKRASALHNRSKAEASFLTPYHNFTIIAAATPCWMSNTFSSFDPSGAFSFFLELPCKSMIQMFNRRPINKYHLY